MKLNGIGGGLGVRPPQTEPRTRVEQERGSANGAAAVPTQAPAKGVGPTRPLTSTRAATLPPEAPEGTDPELWSVLTAEERVFFAKVGAMGPLTYGHIMTSGGTAGHSGAPVKRGGRLDIRI